MIGSTGITLAGIGDEAGTSIEAQLAAIERLGWSAIELRTVDGVALEEVSERGMDRISAAVHEAAVDVVCIDSRIAGWSRPITSSFELDRRELLALAPRARRLGCPYLRIMSYPNDGLADADWRREVVRRLRELAAVARDEGVVLLHENCAGWAGRDARSTVRLLEDVDSSSLRLLFDIGNGLAYGYSSTVFLQDVLPWIEHVHVKDGIVEDGDVRWTWPGEGDADVVACLDLLSAAGYRKALAIEPHLSVIPHAGVDRPSADLFVRHGQIAEALVRQRCAPGAPTVTTTTGRSGLVGPDHLDLLLELLEIPTVNPLEAPATPDALERHRLGEALSRYASAAEQIGLVVQHFEAAPVRLLDAPCVPVAVKEHAAAAGPVFLDSQPNLVLRSPGPRDPSRTVLFNFHMDTVAGDVPVGLAGGRVTGRGAVDDKGPGVAVLAGYEAACRVRPDLVDEISVAVAAVAGEEGGAMGVYGTRAVVEAGHVGRLQVFCEPTGNRFFDHCTTSMTAAIDVRGEDACDDVAHEGHNATVLLGFLADWFASEVLPGIESVGGRCCIAGSHTGTRHNKVYGSGRTFLNIAYSDRDAHRAIARCVEEGLATGIERFTARYADQPSLSRTAKDAAAIASVSWMKRGLPVLANRDRDLEAMLTRTVGVPRIDDSSQDQLFTCDAIWAGAPGRYTVVCGPGTLGSNRAHGDGEFVDVDDLDRFATIVRDLILAFGTWVSR